MTGEHHDFIIVGGGPAGCVLAARLTEDPARSVLLLEAGPDYGPDNLAWPEDIRDPGGLRTDSHPWGYRTAETSLHEPVDLPRARVLGGSSTINGCAWFRGSRADYDFWRDAGNAGWGFDDLLPYFKKAEADPLPDAHLHGDSGPVPVFRILEEQLSPALQAFVATAEELGINRVDDLNGFERQQPAIGPVPKNIKNGMRMNGTLTYLAQARKRPNLRTLPDTHIDRVLIDDEAATGLVDTNGNTFTGDEVILCAGAYGSPAILMRSGVGPAQHLQELGIDVVLDLPGVGEHLMDHPLASNRFMSFLVDQERAARRPAWAEVMARARSNQVGEEIDLHIYPFQSFNDELDSWILSFAVSLEYSRSRGHVRLTSADPEATLHIDHCYFSDPVDLEALCDGVEIVEQITLTPPLSTMLTQTDDNMLRFRSRDERRELIRGHVGTSFHPSSTCRMGPASDPTAVVDTQGRIHNLRNLRVVDASIFPWGPRCNLHFPVVAVAERLADLIRDDAHSQDNGRMRVVR
jgi:choline dehydrogenase